jgi:uncharacterized protein YndB with AHSA1/START domain
VSDVETVERVIQAPPEAIFALIADPRRHHEFDGSGSVRGARELPDHLELGSTFGMSMKVGVPYSTKNTVIEFEPNRRLAWQTFVAHFGGGRIWRYELEPVEGGTRVRESWDISKEKIKFFVMPARSHTRKAMTSMLERIEKIVTAPAQ